MPRKTRDEGYFLESTGDREHLGVPRARRDPRCVLILVEGGRMGWNFQQLDALRPAADRAPGHERRL